MSHIRSGHRAIVVVLALTVGSELCAQRLSSDPSAADVAALLRERGSYGAAVSVLTQARGPQPRQKMDEIADSLRAIAVSFPGKDARGSSTRSAAQTALLLAGMGESGIVGIDRAVPYAGAADRLMQIAKTAEDVGIRSAALSGLTKLPNKAQVLPFLRTIAMSQSPVAYRAVNLLAEETGLEGRAIARELYRNGRVTEPVAKELLGRSATVYGWQ